MADLVQELRELVEPGDYGDVKYLKHRVQHKLAASIDRYVEDEAGSALWSARLLLYCFATHAML